MPGRRVFSIGGETIESIAYRNARVNQPLHDSLYLLPAGVPNLTDSVPQFAKVELGKGVWLLQELTNGYNALAVAFKDHVMVVEPASTDVESKRAIAAVKELAPGKPIRYIVATHHHEDHAGGVRSYIAEGATVVTTAGNRAYFERIAASRRTIAPDDLSARPRKPAFELVTRRRTFSDGERTVELVDVGPSPHATRSWWRTCRRRRWSSRPISSASAGARPCPPAIPTRRISRSGCRNWGSTPSGSCAVHGRPATRAELEESVGKRVAAAE